MKWAINMVGTYVRAGKCTRVAPKVISKHFFACKPGTADEGEYMLVDGTSCCVILECLVTSIACIT